MEKKVGSYRLFIIIIVSFILMEKVAKCKNLNLYSYWRSSCSWRVRIVLNHKGIDYEYTPVHLIKEGGQQFKENFTKLNPMQRVPVLEFDYEGKKVHLAESMAICEFLEEEYPEKHLLPKDHFLRGKVRAICSEIASGIQPLQNLSVLNRIETLGLNKTEWAKEHITKGLNAVEILVSETKGKYCVGDEISFADAFLKPQLYNARRFDIDLTVYPNLIEVEQNLNSLEAFIEAHPDKQPDCNQ
jgi:maleylpyruvate isomerase